MSDENNINMSKLGIGDSKCPFSTTSTSSTAVQLNEFLTETYENLFKFKNESLFTDVQIYVEGVEFPCHKVVINLMNG